jgi:prepilin-type N-terminal cleavage/methylation domain-containing protein
MMWVKNTPEARRGMTLLETTVALFIVSAVLLAILQLVSVTANQRRTLEERRIALQEVANQAERIALLPWERTAPDEMKEWQPGNDLLAVAPKAKCVIAVSPESGSPPGRKIRLSVTETTAVEQRVELATLTIWKFDPSAAP